MKPIGVIEPARLGQLVCHRRICEEPAALAGKPYRRPPGEADLFQDSRYTFRAGSAIVIPRANRRALLAQG
jgi:hypothetical protein